MKKEVSMCCKIGCNKSAKVSIYYGTSPDDYTESCLEHIGDLLTIAPVHHLYWIEKKEEDE